MGSGSWVPYSSGAGGKGSAGIAYRLQQQLPFQGPPRGRANGMGLRRVGAPMAQRAVKKESDVAGDSAPSNVTDLLDRIGEVAERGPVSLGMVLETFGRRFFGPILLVAGLVTLVPLIGDIPGVPTIMGVLVLLTSVQLLTGRSSLWLPPSLLARKASGEAVQRSLRWMRRPARWLDRVTRPRLTAFATGVSVYAIAAVCLVIAIAMPPMELVPFSANGAGITLTAFGLALIGQDGLLALAAFAVTGMTVGGMLAALL